MSSDSVASMENSPRLAPAKKDFDSRSAFSSILNLNNTIDSILNSLGPLISSGSTTPSLPISPPALAPEACKTRASLLRSTDSGGRPNNAPIRAPLTQSRFLTGIELAYDSSLPSYARIRRLQHVGLGEIIAARELDFQWIKGRSCGRIVALKIFKKRHILEENAKPVVLNELLAYQRVEKSRVKGKAFIFCPGSSFETLKHVVFVMDFLPYTLSYLLKYRRGDREEFKRKLTAQLALALSAIHSLGFVHCDIRPENILLDAQYNARISCFTIDTLHYNNITGTWPYMAPEAIVPTDTDESVSYSATVDYWSLGCVVFELESGDKPRPMFRNQEDITRYCKYKLGGQPYPPFTGMSEDTQSLIFGLVCVDPKVRLNATKLKQHPYFKATTGENEFNSLCKLPGRQSTNFPFVEMDEETTNRPTVYHPIDTSTSEESKYNDIDFSQFQWNPRTGMQKNKRREHILFPG